MNPLTHDWIKKAEEDFLVASQIMRRKKQRVFNAACFLCQQCVEKYFKARLHEEEIPFPKTHDLVLLLELLEAVEPLWVAYTEIARSLTGYAVNFRYPGEDANLADAELALKNCKSLRAEVRRSLGLKK